MLSSPQDITYFIEVANTLNLSRAAERLGIAQPSLSLAIKRIENSIGAKVLHRSKTGVTLTIAGEQLLIYSNKILRTWEDLRNKILLSESEAQGTISFGMHPSVALYSSSGFIPKLLTDYPKLNLKLHHDLSRKITEQIISGSIDIGIVINPVKHPDLILTQLCTDTVTVWNRKDSSKCENNLLNSTVPLICNPELAQSQYILNKINNCNIRFNRIITTSSLEVIADLVSKGAGIGILPERVAHYIAGSELVKMKDSPVFLDEIYLAYRLEIKNLKTTQVIVSSIKEYFLQPISNL